MEIILNTRIAQSILIFLVMTLGCVEANSQDTWPTMEVPHQLLDLVMENENQQKGSFQVSRQTANDTLNSYSRLAYTCKAVKSNGYIVRLEQKLEGKIIKSCVAWVDATKNVIDNENVFAFGHISDAPMPANNSLIYRCGKMTTAGFVPAPPSDSGVSIVAVIDGKGGYQEMRVSMD